MNRQIGHWVVKEPEVLDEIVAAGYRYIRENELWIKSDIPIQFNGIYPLRHYKVLRSLGTMLTLLTDRQLEQKEVEDFDREWSKQNS